MGRGNKIEFMGGLKAGGDRNSKDEVEVRGRDEKYRERSVETYFSRKSTKIHEGDPTEVF